MSKIRILSILVIIVFFSMSVVGVTTATPTVTSIDPPNGAAGVPISTSITISLSGGGQTINYPDASVFNIKLKVATSGAEVPLKLTMFEGTHCTMTGCQEYRIILKPENYLAPGTTYMITIPKGSADGDYTSYFTTAGSAPAPSISITTVQRVQDHGQYLEWDIINTGTPDVWVAPLAGLYEPTIAPPNYVRDGTAIAVYAFDVTSNNWTTVYSYSGMGWFFATHGHTYRIFSGPVVPSNAKWATYNAFIYVNGVSFLSSTTWSYASI